MFWLLVPSKIMSGSLDPGMGKYLREYSVNADITLKLLQLKICRQYNAEEFTIKKFLHCFGFGLRPISSTTCSQPSLTPSTIAFLAAFSSLCKYGVNNSSTLVAVSSSIVFNCNYVKNISIIIFGPLST